MMYNCTCLVIRRQRHAKIADGLTLRFSRAAPTGGCGVGCNRLLARFRITPVANARRNQKAAREDGQPSGRNASEPHPNVKPYEVEDDLLIGDDSLLDAESRLEPLKRRKVRTGLYG